MNPLAQYTSDLFAPEDDVLRELRAEMPRRGIPEINVNALEGRLLQFLLHSVNAHKALEIGALAGYSGIWLARALPPAGRLITLEINPLHAATAREFYAKAGVADKIDLREGAALDILPQLASAAPFDFCFIDADKANNPAYIEHALRLVRRGGLIAIDNAYRHGSILDPADQTPDVLGVRESNRMMATDPRLFSTIISTTDGLAVGIVQLPFTHQGGRHGKHQREGSGQRRRRRGAG